MRWRNPFRRTPDHRHEYTWRTEAQEVGWLVLAQCSCGHISWSRTVADSGDLQVELKRSFHAGELSALGYFTAPVKVAA